MTVIITHKLMAIKAIGVQPHMTHDKLIGESRKGTSRTVWPVGRSVQARRQIVFDQIADQHVT